KVSHLIAPKIKDVGSPVRVLTLARVQMLVKSGSVKTPQCEFVFGEMGRNPVQDYPDPLLMEGIHEILEVVRRAETSGWCEVGGNLVTPGAAKGMFHDGHELHMGKSQL